MKLIMDEPLPVLKIQESLSEAGFPLRYEDSIYKELSVLVAAGLVEKYKNTMGKAKGSKKKHLYKSNVEKVVINLNTLKVDLIGYNEQTKS